MSQEPKDSGEEIVVLPTLPTGERPFLRCREGQVEMGHVVPIKEGQPIYDNAVHLEHKEGPVFTARPLLPTASKGPAKVVSRAYRDNYDGIFGKKEVGQA